MSTNTDSDDTQVSKHTQRERKYYKWYFRKYPCARVKRGLSRYRTFGFQVWRTDYTRTLDIWLGSYLYVVTLNWWWDER